MLTDDQFSYISNTFEISSNLTYSLRWYGGIQCRQSATFQLINGSLARRGKSMNDNIIAVYVPTHMWYAQEGTQQWYCTDARHYDTLLLPALSLTMHGRQHNVNKQVTEWNDHSRLLDVWPARQHCSWRVCDCAWLFSPAANHMISRSQWKHGQRLTGALSSHWHMHQRINLATTLLSSRLSQNKNNQGKWQ